MLVHNFYIFNKELDLKIWYNKAGWYNDKLSNQKTH